MDKKNRKRLNFNSEAGNVFFALFGAVGVLGAVGATAIGVMTGPMKTMTEVSQRAVAESEIMANSKLSVMSVATMTDQDCDKDGTIEPMPWENPGSDPAPTGGGVIPAGVPITNDEDPWDSKYGYCVWDHGSSANAGGCAGDNRLAGVDNSNYPVIAIISAGADRIFQTSCNAAIDGNADNIPDNDLIGTPEGSDDIVLSFTYAEAAIATSSTWKVKDDETTTAELAQDRVEVTGDTQVLGRMDLTGGGLLLPQDPGDDSISGACNIANNKSLRVNTSSTPSALEICDFSGSGDWTAISSTYSGGGGGGSTSACTGEASYIYSTGGGDNTVRKIDSSGTQSWSFTNHTDSAESVAVDADGNIYSSSEDDTVRKIDSSGSEVWSFTGHTGDVNAVAVDADGNVYSGSSDNTVRKIDSSGSQIWSFTGHTGFVLAVAVDADGNVYSGSSDNTVRKIDPSGTQIWSFTGHTGLVYGVAVDEDGNVYSASTDDTVRKIDSSGTQTWSFTGHTGNALAVAVDVDGNVYSGSADDTVRKIDSSGTQTWSFTGHTNDVWGVSVDSSGNVYSASVDGTMRKIDSSGTQTWSFTGYIGSVSSSAVIAYPNCPTSDLPSPNTGGAVEEEFSTHQKTLQEATSDGTAANFGTTIQLNNTEHGAQAGIGMRIDSTLDDDSMPTAAITAMRQGDAGQGGLAFKTQDSNNAFGPRAYLDSDGDFGLDTTAGLDVLGTLQIGQSPASSWDTDYTHGLLSANDGTAIIRGPDGGIIGDWTDTPTETKVTALDGAANDNFGNSVAISEEYALVGSYYDDDNGNNSGSAYVFDLSDGSQIYKLTASDGAAEDDFGNSVAINESYALVASRRDDDDGVDSGSVYVFDLSDGSQVYKLTASDGAAGDLFGSSVSVSGDYAVIGAQYDDDGAISAGSAYVFDLSDGSQIYKLTASDGAANDNFGNSVAVSGDYAVIGSHRDGDKGFWSGSAYVFDLTDGSQIYKLTASDGAADDLFGSSVSVSGDYAVIGAQYDDDGAINAGSAYVFDLSDGSEVYKLTASDGAIDDSFGGGVTVSGDYVIISARNDDDGAINAGSAYVFDLSDGSQIQKITASDGADDDIFGDAIALNANYAVIGAWRDDDGGSASGSAYIFEVTATSSPGIGYFGLEGTDDRSATILYSGDLKFYDTSLNGETLTELMRLDSSGTATFYDNQLDMVGNGDVSAASYSDTTPSIVHLNRYNGTAASSTTVADGDLVGSLLWGGYDGSMTADGEAAIYGEVNGSVSAGVVPVDLHFSIDQAGAATSSSDMVITSNGNVGIGTTSPAATLDVNERITIDEGLRIGIDSTCSGGSDDGVLRLTSGTLEYCDGSSWQSIFGGCPEACTPSVNNVQTAQSDNTGSITISSYTVPDLDNRVLIVAVGGEDDTTTDPVPSTTATFNGVSMTRIDTSMGTLSGWGTASALYYLDNPTATTGDIVVNYAGTTLSTTAAAFVVDCLASGGPEISAKSNADGFPVSTPYSTSITTQSDGAFVVDAYAVNNNNTIAEGGSQTSIANVDNPGGHKLGVSYILGVTAGSESLSWSHTGGDQNRVGHLLASFERFDTSGGNPACSGGSGGGGGGTTGCSSIGDQCDDDTIYAGTSPDGSEPMYTTPCDAGQTWSSGSCTGTRDWYSWNDGNTNYVDTSLTDYAGGSATLDNTGEANTNTLDGLDSSTAGGTQEHEAAQYCADLDIYGYDDWYLPAGEESKILATNYIAIGNFESSASYPQGFYWTSTESFGPGAFFMQMDSNSTSNVFKETSGRVRCVRKGAAPSGGGGGGGGGGSGSSSSNDVPYEGYAWGRDDNGQLGDDSTQADQNTPAAIDGSLEFVKLSGGLDHSCGITENNDMYCWGNDSNGQLGNAGGGSTNVPNAAQPVDGSHKWRHVTTGALFTCGITTEHKGYCWGYGANSTLGNGSSTSNEQSPEPIIGGHRWKTIDAYSYHGVCGVTLDGEGYCWGVEFNGEHGDDSTGSETIHTPTIVDSGNQVWQKIVKGNESSCGLDVQGDAYCWGNDSQGIIGNGGGNDGPFTTPEAVTGGHKFIDLEVGSRTACGIKVDGSLWCWGEGDAIPDGVATDRFSPVDVSNDYAWKKLSGSGGSICGLTENNLTFCWGEDNNGQLGNGGSNTDSTDLETVDIASKFINVFPGEDHNMGIVAAENNTPNVECSPNSFTISDITDSTTNTLETSDQITIAGLQIPCTLFVSTDSSEVNIVHNSSTLTDPFVRVENGDTVELEIRSSNSADTTVTTIVKLGDKQQTVEVTTAP